MPHLVEIQDDFETEHNHALLVFKASNVSMYSHINAHSPLSSPLSHLQPEEMSELHVLGITCSIMQAIAVSWTCTVSQPCTGKPKQLQLQLLLLPLLQSEHDVKETSMNAYERFT